MMTLPTVLKTPSLEKSSTSLMDKMFMPAATLITEAKM
jgi:hypothetical protein